MDLDLDGMKGQTEKAEVLGYGEGREAGHLWLGLIPASSAGTEVGGCERER